MARRGTFKTIVATLGKKMSDVRSAFGRTAAKIAKEVMNDYLATVDAIKRSAILARPGELWRTVVRYIYKAVGEVVRDKVRTGTLSIDQYGYFNITKDEVLPRAKAAGIDADVKNVLSIEYGIA